MLLSSNHRMEKRNFIVDIVDKTIRPALLEQLAGYNDAREPERRIERLWVFSKGKLHAVTLRTKNRGCPALSYALLFQG